MLIGSILKNIATRVAISKGIPLAKTVLRGAGKKVAQEAQLTVADKTVNPFTKAPKKVEEFVNKKKSEFYQEAEGKAEQFFARQMEILDGKIDEKIDEVEERFDEKIRVIFWLFIVSTFIIMILAGLTFSLLFRYFEF